MSPSRQTDEDNDGTIDKMTPPDVRRKREAENLLRFVAWVAGGIAILCIVIAIKEWW